MAVKIEDSLQVAAAPSDSCLEIGGKGTLYINIFNCRLQKETYKISF